MAQATAALDRIGDAGETQRRASAGLWSDAAWRLRHDPTTIVAIFVVLLMVILAVSADVLADNFFHWSFAKQDLLNAYRKPNLEEPAFWLGADHIGRSQVVRLLYGARVSLFIGIFGMIVTLSLGLVVGISAGYFRGWWDDVVVWMVSTLNSIPTIYLLLIIGFLFRLDPLSLALLIGAIFGIRYLVFAAHHVSTDDAQVGGNITTISPRVRDVIACSRA